MTFYNNDTIRTHERALSSTNERLFDYSVVLAIYVHEFVTLEQKLEASRTFLGHFCIFAPKRYGQGRGHYSIIEKPDFSRLGTFF